MRGDGDGWVFDPDGARYWGVHGAAGLLLRHDYTADVIGGWATAANRCLASAVVDGLRFYTRRLVTPRFGDHVVLPGPTLVWIELDDIRVHRRVGAPA